MDSLIYCWRDIWQKQQDELWSVQIYTLTYLHIQWNATELIGCFSVQRNDNPKHTAQPNLDFWRKINGKVFNGWVSHLVSTQQSSFSVTKDETEGRETYKEAATDSGYSEGLAKHLQGRILEYSDILW